MGVAHGKPMNVPEELADNIRNNIRAYGPMNEGGVSFLIEKTYPEVDQFKIEVFPNEGKHRGRPHCRVTTDKGAITVDLASFEILAGDAGPWNHTVKKVIADNAVGLMKFCDTLRPDDQKLPAQ
jgi:hypothetical protein